MGCDSNMATVVAMKYLSIVSRVFSKASLYQQKHSMLQPAVATTIIISNNCAFPPHLAYSQ